MKRERLARNLVILDGVVKCRIKRRNKFHEWTSPLQGEHAYSVSKDGLKSPRPAVLKWLGRCEKAIAEERWEALNETRIRGGTPTVQEIMAAYVKQCELKRATTGSPVVSSMTASVASFRRLCAEAGVSQSDRISKLTTETIEAWMKSRSEKYPKGFEREHAIYVLNSMLRQAKSLFARWILIRYSKAGMEIPECVRQWPNYNDVWQPRYVDPPAELKRKTIDKAEELRAARPRAWVLYWIMVNFGCRTGDAMRLTWGNFVMIKGETGERRYLVYKPNKTRASKGNTVTIPVSDSVWTELQLTRPRGSDADDSFIVQATKFVDSRRRHTVVDLNNWMREIGWDAKTYNKASYELRKLITSAVRNTYGVQLASDWCGSSVAMVQQYYAATYVERMPVIDASAVIRGT
jgi:integrase